MAMHHAAPPSSPKNEPHCNDKPTRETLALGFVCFNFMGVAVLGTLAGMWWGVLCRPRSVGLYVVLPYWTYTLIIHRPELKDGAHSIAFSKNSFLLNLARRFFQMRIAHVPAELSTADAKPAAQFIIAAFPHGCFADYRAPMDGILHQALPHTAATTRTLAATVLFRIPIVREFALWTGCVDARRSVAEAVLDAGRSIVVVPGGEAEQIRTTRFQEIVYLKQRKGFLKLALRKNIPVVPLYAFGASDYYHTSHSLFGPREWIQKKLGVCIPLAMGYFGSFLCPIPVKTTLVFGKPLQLECKVPGAPTDEEIDAAHAKFMVELQQLFDEHKHAAGFGERKIQLV